MKNVVIARISNRKVLIHFVAAAIEPKDQIGMQKRQIRQFFIVGDALAGSFLLYLQSEKRSDLDPH